MSEIQTYKLLAGNGQYIVEAVVIKCGTDLAVTIAGGEAYHIGASALATPRPSLTGEDKISASASVICAVGHKEDLLARQAALDLASEFNCRVNVTVGLHIDHATAADINELEINYKEVLKEIQQIIRTSNQSSPLN